MLVACITYIVNITVEHARLRHHTNIHAAIHEATRETLNTKQTARHGSPTTHFLTQRTPH